MPTSSNLTKPCIGKFRVIIPYADLKTPQLMSKALDLADATVVHKGFQMRAIVAELVPDSRQLRHLERCAEEHGIVIFRSRRVFCSCGCGVSAAMIEPSDVCQHKLHNCQPAFQAFAHEAAVDAPAKPVDTGTWPASHVKINGQPSAAVADVPEVSPEIPSKEGKDEGREGPAPRPRSLFDRLVRRVLRLIGV
jgi:hypothetical protein